MTTSIRALILGLILSTSFFANAFDLKLENLGPWKLTVIEKKSVYLGNAEATLTLPRLDNDFSPTVLIEKLPMAAAPESREEWHHLIFLNANKGKFVVMNERAFKTGTIDRYVVEFRSDIGADSMLHSIVMATSINGEIYAFHFQNFPKTFGDHVRAIRQLFRTMEVSISRSTRP